jgi:hypothetical protein
LTRTVRADIEWVRCKANACRDCTNRRKLRCRKVRVRAVKRYVNKRFIVADVCGSRIRSERVGGSGWVVLPVLEG